MLNQQGHWRLHTLQPRSLDGHWQKAACVFQPPLVDLDLAGGGRGGPLPDEFRAGPETLGQFDRLGCARPIRLRPNWQARRPERRLCCRPRSTGTRHDAGAPPPPTQVEGRTPQKLEEVLRFDITPAWIIERWPRVSSGLSELDLQGYRVALVTGTTDSDLAGSLTYYFDNKNQVDRIIFHGSSGDPGQLVALVTSRYELKKQKTDDPSRTLFQRKLWGKSVSELRIRPAPVLRSDMPQARYEIELAHQAAIARNAAAARVTCSRPARFRSG